MTTRASKYATGQLSTVNGDCAGDTISSDYFYDIPAAQLIAGDIIDLGVLPANHTIGDAILICDDIDTNGTPLVSLDVGIMSGVPGDITSARTCGAELFSADTSARTAAISRMTLPTGFKIAPVQYDRSIGVKIVAAPATAAAGRIRVRVFMHPSDTQF